MAPAPLRRVAVSSGHHFPGGPATFQRYLVDGLRARGVDVASSFDAPDLDAVLVINATRQVPPLARLKRQGVRIVQRLGNVLRPARGAPSNGFAGVRERARFVVRNQAMAWVRRYLASDVVYQTEAVREAWSRYTGPTRAREHVIVNGVDLERFHPGGDRETSGRALTVLGVEGTHGRDPTDAAVALAKGLAARGIDAEVRLIGGDDGAFGARVASIDNLSFLGVKPWEELPAHYRGADVVLATDVDAGCPNAVVEALACGTPVIAHRMPVFAELVPPDVGVLAEPGYDATGRVPWRDDALVDACLHAWKERENFAAAARARAEAHHEVGAMVAQYVAVLAGDARPSKTAVA